jgi:hypothetical protein
MPYFSHTIDFNFEVYCDTCGSGLCGESREVTTLKRGVLSLRVKACPECMKSKDSEIDDLKREIERLKEKLSNAYADHAL